MPADDDDAVSAGRAPASIAVAGVARSFGAVPAVREVTFTVEPGTVAGLIGPNGAGKTTLLLMLATLLAPTAGSIRIGGIDPVDDPVAVRRLIGWMPDALGSWPSLSVRAALETTGRLSGLQRGPAADRARELVAQFGLDPLADRPTRVLSRGQKQKLGLARALVHDPQVLLLDEPASGLDPAARVELRERVRRFAAEGRTVLVSSHVLAELEEMVDTAVFLDGGVSAPAEAVERAARAARPWRIRSLDGAALRGALEEAAPGLARGEGEGADRGGMLVPIADDAAAARLLAELVGRGVPVTFYAPAVGELEHVFLDLAGNGRSAPPPGGPTAAPADDDETEAGA